MPDELCTCDAFPEPHPAGTVDGRVYCETLYTAPTVSPHLFGVGPDGERP